MRLREQIVKANLLVREASYIAEELDKRTEYKVTLQIPASSLDANRKVRSLLMEETKMSLGKTAIYFTSVIKHQGGFALLPTYTFCSLYPFVLVLRSPVEFAFNYLPLCVYVLCPLECHLHLYPPHPINLFPSTPFLHICLNDFWEVFPDESSESGVSSSFCYHCTTPSSLSYLFILHIPCYFHLLTDCSAKLFISCSICVFRITDIFGIL